MMQYKGYIGTVEFDAEERTLHGEVAGIRDVVTFQGRSVTEIERAFRDSVDDYIAFCKERGEDPDKPCSGRFIVRIDTELHRRASAMATARKTSLNTLVADALRQHLREAPDCSATVGTSRRRRAAG